MTGKRFVDWRSDLPSDDVPGRVESSKAAFAKDAVVRVVSIVVILNVVKIGRIAEAAIRFDRSYS